MTDMGARSAEARIEEYRKLKREKKQLVNAMARISGVGELDVVQGGPEEYRSVITIPTYVVDQYIKTRIAEISKTADAIHI